MYSLFSDFKNQGTNEAKAGKLRKERIGHVKRLYISSITGHLFIGNYELRDQSNIDLQLIEKFQANLGDKCQPLSQVQLTDAMMQDLQFSLSSLVQLERSDESKESKLTAIIRFLSVRWALIKGTELDYTDNPKNPINRWCVAIANYLSHKFSELSACQLLMPTVKRLAGKKSMAYTLKEATEDEGASFKPSQYLFVNQGFSCLLDVADFLSYANVNTLIVFKQFQSKRDNACQYKELLEEDYDKLSTLTPNIKAVYGILYERHRQQFADKSLGRALRDLAKSLREIPFSNSECYRIDLANSLLNLWNIYRKLPKSVKDDMMNYSIGSKNIKNVLLTLFYANPYCSKDMSNTEINIVKSLSFFTCISVLSNDIDELLNACENQWLFQLRLNGQSYKGKQVIKLSDLEIQQAIDSLLQRKPQKSKNTINIGLLSVLLKEINRDGCSFAAVHDGGDEAELNEKKAANITQDLNLIEDICSQLTI